MLDDKLTYCMQPLRMNATEMTPYCVLRDAPDYGMSCEDFMEVWDLNIEKLSAWNSGVGANCENWLLGRDYCVMVKHFRPPRIVSNCNQYTVADTFNCTHPYLLLHLIANALRTR
jgi:hypothetical protein